MPTKELPAGQFSVSQLAKEIGVDPRMARAKLRKLNGKGVPPVVKNNDLHIYNESWTFLNKHKDKVRKLIAATGVTKKAKVEKEDADAAEDLASADVEDNEDEEELEDE